MHYAKHFAYKFKKTTEVSYNNCFLWNLLFPYYCCIHYSLYRSPFWLLSDALLLAIVHVLLDLVFIVEVMCCVTTQVHAHMMTSPVLGYWLPAENSCSLDFTVMRGARSLSLTKMVPWRINLQEDTDRETMVLPVFRVLFTETKLEEERSHCTADWSRDQACQMMRSRSVAGGWQGSLLWPKYHPNAPP
jgi:hypothetical protein